VPTHNGLWAHDKKSLFPSGPEPPHQNPKKLIKCCQPWSGISSLQCRELLAKSQVFKKESTTSAEESRDRTYQESDGVYHARVLSHFACGRQRCILLKSQADRILANDSLKKAVEEFIGKAPERRADIRAPGRRPASCTYPA
jgi:hypothetical protein